MSPTNKDGILDCSEQIELTEMRAGGAPSRSRGALLGPILSVRFTWDSPKYRPNQWVCDIIHFMLYGGITDQKGLRSEVGRRSTSSFSRSFISIQPIFLLVCKNLYYH